MKTKTMFSFVTALLLLFFSACSNQGMYEGLKHRERLMCNQVPPSEYEECMRNTDKNYEDYKRQREEVKN